ncbi:ribonuclease P protein subunit p20 [Drosophila bipectinata]|uniref:ribonuclease P protein subunit p20 n=1 Tax=Drosophila bipectinata TaxID=42026 RepID=UPI0007E686F1|nr:ribonuclease P protein subunit p20 [Drosophila bipectinata]
MESNASQEHGAKPRSNNRRNNNQRHRVVRKQPPRPASGRQHIYITRKTDFKAQLRRCQELFSSGAKEIFLHCMGFSVTRGLNLALRLIEHSEGTLSYAINTSTISLLDELHPLCDEEDLTFRHRKNSALHIKIFNRSLFEIAVPPLPAAPTPQLQTQSQFRGKAKSRQ